MTAGTATVPIEEVGLFEGLLTTRAIRRYVDEPVPTQVLRDILFAASRAPSGSNRQHFRFVVLTDEGIGRQARELIAASAREIWTAKEDVEGYCRGSGERAGSPKSRMAATMREYVDSLASVPVMLLPCLVRFRGARSSEGGSIYPACQNLLLAARALGYGGVLTGFQRLAEAEIRTLLGIPDEAFIAGTITLGRPAGRHGPVRRRPLGEVVYENTWNASPGWATDPPGTRHTAAGPPLRQPEA